MGISYLLFNPLIMVNSSTYFLRMLFVILSNMLNDFSREAFVLSVWSFWIYLLVSIAYHRKLRFKTSCFFFKYRTNPYFLLFHVYKLHFILKYKLVVVNCCQGIFPSFSIYCYQLDMLFYLNGPSSFHAYNLHFILKQN